MQYPVHITLRAQGPGVHVLEMDVEARNWYEALALALAQLEEMPVETCLIAEASHV